MLLIFDMYFTVKRFTFLGYSMKDYPKMFRFIQTEYTEVQWGSTVGCSYRSRLATRGERAFSVRASSLWNTLPPALRQAGNLNTFKLLKMFLFSQAFDWILVCFCTLYIFECFLLLCEALCNHFLRKVPYKLSFIIIIIIINNIINLHNASFGPLIGFEIFSKWNHWPGTLLI